MSTLPSPLAYTPPASVVDDDGGYDYFWNLGGIDVRIPRWLAEIIDVQPMVRLEIFLIGLCCGLVTAATTLLLAIYLTVA